MASSSKLLTLTLGSSLLCYRLPPSSSLLPAPSHRFSRPFLSLRFCSAAATADVAADVAASALAAAHPWPEWGAFLEKLRAKGYFERPAPASVADAGEAAGDGEAAATDDSVVASAYPYPFRDQNRVKNACLRFARERFDLLSALPKQDIQAVVECGCPNIFRKAVNSAKRLRAFLQFDEADACSVCKLRGSCDKAYVNSKDEEGARTVDVVRILLSYAIDPTSLSGENSVGEGVQESARKLLSELVVLSDTVIDPSLPEPVFKTSSKQKSSPKIVEKIMYSVGKSRVSAGKVRETAQAEMKKGDWLCPNCNFLNFARNRHCLECKADGPKKIEAATSEMKLGDWICSQCHFMNFARNMVCFKCEECRPKRQLGPGEWECPSCDFVNFRRNKVCLKCNHDRPVDENQDNHLGYHLWRNTTRTRKSSSFDSGDKEEEEEEDILPYEGERKFVLSKRATPAQRRFTAARNQ